MKIVKPNWHGFDHAAVDKQFGGELTFVNDFCVNGEYHPSAVYRAAKPDKKKGHKKYVLLSKIVGLWYVRGMSPQKITQFSKQEAVHCLSCDSIVYSVMRHDYRHCECGKVSIDGGRDYTKIGFEASANYKLVTLNLLHDTIS